MLEKAMVYTTADGAKAGTVILTLDGPFTLGNMFQLQAELRKLQPPCLIMDMDAVPYMDSAGLGVIMNYCVAAQSAGRKFFLTRVNERVLGLFQMTKVDSFITMYDSIETAQSHA